MSYAPGYSSTSPSGSDAHWKVAAATAPALILSASFDRSHASIFNHSVNALYLRFGNGRVDQLSVTGAFDVKVTSGSYYELPKPIWTGEVWGIWDAAGGSAMVLSLGKE